MAMESETLAPADTAKVRAGIDLVREATTFLRTLKFAGSPDGKELLGKLNDAHIEFAESRVMFSEIPLGKARAKPMRGGTSP